MQSSVYIVTIGYFLVQSGSYNTFGLDKTNDPDYIKESDGEADEN